jgi:hypothetical protein
LLAAIAAARPEVAAVTAAGHAVAIPAISVVGVVISGSGADGAGLQRHSASIDEATPLPVMRSGVSATVVLVAVTRQPKQH